jgi:hypothetical protein
MTQLVLDNNLIKFDESGCDIINEDNFNNYRGYFHGEEETDEKYFEYGAHFPYKYLCKKLEEILQYLSPNRKVCSPMKTDLNFRKVNESKSKGKISRNNVFNKNAFIKSTVAPLNVTENFSSIVKNNIKSRNLENIYKPVDKTPNLKNTYNNKLSYKIKKNDNDKQGINIYTSYNDTNYNIVSRTNNITNKNKSDKLTFEKTNPVLLVDKNNKPK